MLPINKINLNLSQFPNATQHSVVAVVVNVVVVDICASHTENLCSPEKIHIVLLFKEHYEKENKLLTLPECSSNSQKLSFQVLCN